MIENMDKIASKLLEKSISDLTKEEKKFIDNYVKHVYSSVDVAIIKPKLTVGQHLADKVANFCGSWKFIIIFISFLAIWMGLNSMIPGDVPDPFPYILLNLILAVVATLEAPLIMMSQNRTSDIDRNNAMHIYKVIIKLEIEMQGLYEKILHIEKKIDNLHNDIHDIKDHDRKN